jgi:hypothetical protein
MHLATQDAHQLNWISLRKIWDHFRIISGLFKNQQKYFHGIVLETFGLFVDWF